MEKHGEIRQGETPREDDDQKKASADTLAEHVTKRIADAAKEKLNTK